MAVPPAENARELRSALEELYIAADAFYAAANYDVRLDIDGKFSTALLSAERVLTGGGVA